MFESRVIHRIRFCIKKKNCSWAKCSFKVFHVLKNVALSSWPGLSCTKEQISHSPSVYCGQIICCIDCWQWTRWRSSKHRQWGKGETQGKKTKQNRRTRELSLCNSVREPLQQVQQAGLFLSRSLNPDDNFLTLSSSVQYWLARRPTFGRQTPAFGKPESAFFSVLVLSFRYDVQTNCYTFHYI